MSEKVKRLAPVIWQEIKKAKSILLHLHPSPDPDSAGSALAVLFALRAKGKKVTLIKGDSETPQYLMALPGMAEITAKNYTQIDPAEFDLFLILDSGGISQITKFGKVILPEGMTTVAIDHHASNDGYAQINLVDISYPATAQIIYDLFSMWKIKLTPDMANCLLTGLYTDTGGFKYPPANATTLEVAAKLAAIYPDYARTIFAIENSHHPKQIQFLGIALNHIENYFSGRVAISAVPFEELKKNAIEAKYISGTEVSNMLKSVIGWDIGIRLVEKEPHVVTLDFRTRDAQKFDLSKVAMVLNGGGLKAAAGATIKKPFAEAKQDLLAALQKTYPELGKP
jgi:bifunctional oligoribonuclease and PAP phosphatase NrnA